MKRKAREAAAAGFDAAKGATGEIFASVAQQAAAQGLTPDGLARSAQGRNRSGNGNAGELRGSEKTNPAESWDRASHQSVSSRRRKVFLYLFCLAMRACPTRG